jgi:FHA domain
VYLPEAQRFIYERRSNHTAYCRFRECRRPPTVHLPTPVLFSTSLVLRALSRSLQMEILEARLVAIGRDTYPQIIHLPTEPGASIIIGRSHFFGGEEQIISRRHACFTVSSTGILSLLHVSNLSQMNGVLHNLSPIPLHTSVVLRDGDELVSHFATRLILVFLRSTRAHQAHFIGC